MTDYIKREDAIEAIENTDWYHINSQAEMVYGANSDLHQAWYSANDIYSAVENVPTADVAPVRHGWWMEEPYKDDIIVYRCSECIKAHTMTAKGNKAHFNYCPNCGAKMDLED